MGSSRPGHGLILFCDKGTLATEPTNPLAMGFRGAAKMNVTPHAGVKEYLGGELRNMRNFKFTAETFQCTMQMLKAVYGWINCNCDIQAVTSKQSADTQDVWKFIGNNYAGIGFEHVLSSEKRSLTINVERAMPEESAKNFADSTDSEAVVTPAGIAAPKGQDSTLYRSPFFLGFESPKATSLSSVGDILERSLKATTKGKKAKEDNTDIVDFLVFELMLKVRDASIAKLVAHMTRDMASSVYWKESNGGAFYDAYDFAAGSLIQIDEFENTDDDRSITMKFKRDIELFDVSFNFGAAYGGDVGDAALGKKGGTIKVGY